MLLGTRFSLIVVSIFGLTCALQAVARSINAHAGFSQPGIHSGDTLSYTVKVEWMEQGPEIAVAAPEDLNFTAFTVIERKTAFRKSAAEGNTLNSIEFTYHLRSGDAGNGMASAARIPYSDANGTHHLPLASANLEILPPRVPLLERPGFRYTAYAGFVALAFAGGLITRKKFKDKKARENRNELPGWAEEIKRLKSRLAVAESKLLLEDMESLTVRYLRAEIARLDGARKSRSSTATTSDKDIPVAGFDHLLPRYLELMDNAEADSWNKLGDLFRYARYAGGHKERHELSAGYGLLKTCMRVNEEKGDT